MSGNANRKFACNTPARPSTSPATVTQKTFNCERTANIQRSCQQKGNVMSIDGSKYPECKHHGNFILYRDGLNQREYADFLSKRQPPTQISTKIEKLCPVNHHRLAQLAKPNNKFLRELLERQKADLDMIRAESIIKLISKKSQTKTAQTKVLKNGGKLRRKNSRKLKETKKKVKAPHCEPDCKSLTEVRTGVVSRRMKPPVCKKAPDPNLRSFLRSQSTGFTKNKESTESSDNEIDCEPWDLMLPTEDVHSMKSSTMIEQQTTHIITESLTRLVKSSTDSGSYMTWDERTSGMDGKTTTLVLIHENEVESDDTNDTDDDLLTQEGSHILIDFNGETAMTANNDDNHDKVLLQEKPSGSGASDQTSDILSSQSFISITKSLEATNGADDTDIMSDSSIITFFKSSQFHLILSESESLGDMFGSNSSILVLSPETSPLKIAPVMSVEIKKPSRIMQIIDLQQEVAQPQESLQKVQQTPGSDLQQLTTELTIATELSPRTSPFEITPEMPVEINAEASKVMEEINSPQVAPPHVQPLQKVQQKPDSALQQFYQQQQLTKATLADNRRSTTPLFTPVIALRKYRKSDFNKAIEVLVHVTKSHFDQIYVIRKLETENALHDFCRERVSNRSKLFQVDAMDKSIEVKKLPLSDLKKHCIKGHKTYLRESQDVSSKISNQTFTVQRVDGVFKQRVQSDFLSLDIEVAQGSSNKFNVTKFDVEDE